MTTKKVPVSKVKAVDNTKKFDHNDVGLTMTISICANDLLKLLAEHDPMYAGLSEGKFEVTDVYWEADEIIQITLDAVMK